MILGCIKINALGKDEYKKQEGNVVKHYFDYPYFSRIVNPEFFQEELNDEEKKFPRLCGQNFREAIQESRQNL
ncbi:MAG: hypothetical protein LKM45_03705 [Wolbachia endosymbiont of Alcedoecus sp.]|nr:hypothetical protein [Wolbachia endosymbiont of Alcedoecus sp.]